MRAQVGLALAVAALLVGCGQGGPGAAGPAPDGATSVPAVPVPPEETTPPTTEDDMDEDLTRAPGPLDPPATLPGAAALPVDPVGAELVLVVGGPGGEQPPVTLSCDFATGVSTGTHPQAEQACADLLAALERGDPFAPVPPGTMCTQVYGGDAVVQVSGAVLAADGGPVDVQARFSLTDGCEIDRWEQLGAVLAPYGGPGPTTR